ncbi:MAG: hypothetical protein R3F61_04850 [Myxococcota bacterium]
MLALALLFACNKGPMGPDDVRAEMENPSGRLTAQNLPGVADDFFASSEAYDGESLAWGWVGNARGGGTSERLGPDRMADRVRDLANLDGFVSKGLGDIFCATDFLLQLSTFESCDRGNTCEVELVVKACLMRIGEDGDEAAKGKLRFTLREEQDRDFDRGSLSLGFEDWRFTDGDAWAELEGLLAIEGTSWHDGSREEVLYSADFSTRGLDPDARGVFRSGETFDRRVRAAMRFVYEDDGTTETGTIELLAWVDEDGDGDEDGSVVVRFGVEVSTLDTGTMTGLTAELVDATGVWTCTWNVAEQLSDSDGTTWTSAGTCTDPNGESVSFEGSVFED